MTEVVASLIGIATFGIKLTTTLYEFGTNAASAREQTDRIARHLRLYSEVLEVLWTALMTVSQFIPPKPSGWSMKFMINRMIFSIKSET
jgi:hypothetical protein